METINIKTLAMREEQHEHGLTKLVYRIGATPAIVTLKKAMISIDSVSGTTLQDTPENFPRIIHYLLRLSDIYNYILRFMPERINDSDMQTLYNVQDMRIIEEIYGHVNRDEMFVNYVHIQALYRVALFLNDIYNPKGITNLETLLRLKRLARSSIDKIIEYDRQLTKLYINAKLPPLEPMDINNIYKFDMLQIIHNHLLRIDSLQKKAINNRSK